jgi:P27 family predicted phage terminase small subunit
MKGRKVIPIPIKETKGTNRKHRERKSYSPQKDKPISPAWLNKRAKQIFWHMTGRLKAIGLDTRTHTEMLALLSSRMEEVERFDKLLNEKGYTYTTKNSIGSKVIKERPEVAMRKEAARHVHALLVEFGLSPAAQQKVGAPPSKPQNNEFDGF